MTRTWNIDHNVPQDWQELMFDQNIIKITGFVVPLGDGAVGKTSMALTMKSDHINPEWQDDIQKIKKTKNLEFEFINDKIQNKDKTIKILQQFLIPPGQRNTEGREVGRTFEEILEIYRFILKKVDVIILTYKLIESDSFFDLEYWLEESIELIQSRTQIILAGTHLDRRESRDIPDNQITNGIGYITDLVKTHKSDWQGEVSSINISNVDGTNLQALKRLISLGIMRSRGYIEMMFPEGLQEYLSV